MAYLTVELTKEHLILIKNLTPHMYHDSICGIDTYSLFGGTYKYEDMAQLLGVADHIIDNGDIWGPIYDEETTAHLKELDTYITDNILNIEEILHQFCEEGVKEGKYMTKDYEHMWKYYGTEN